MNRVRALTILVSAVLLAGGLVAPPATAGAVWLTSNATWTTDRSASSPLPRVVNLRYAHHQKFDRVVIRVRGSFPGGRSHYQRTFSYDASGLPVPIKGQSGLAVTLRPAYGHDGSGNNLYAGPRIARPHLQTLKALAYTGDFEGHVSFAFALTHRASYRVFTLESPRRIVIDFRHAG
jgi:hypothetical protein